MTKQEAIEVFNIEYRVDPNKGMINALEFIEKIYADGFEIIAKGEED